MKSDQKDKKKKVLGVDIGNVIINNRLIDPHDTTLREERYSTIPEVEGAIAALKKLHQKFDGEVYLISKCTEWAESKIGQWLLDHDFFNKTGIDSSKIHFVRERAQKEPLCKVLGVTHFVDDRLEVLSYMIQTTPNLFLFQPDKKEIVEFETFLPKVTVVQSWSEVVNLI